MIQLLQQLLLPPLLQVQMVRNHVNLPVLLVEAHPAGWGGRARRWPNGDVVTVFLLGGGIMAEGQLSLQEVVGEEGVLVVGLWQLHF